LIHAYVLRGPEAADKGNLHLTDRRVGGSLKMHAERRAHGASQRYEFAARGACTDGRILSGLPQTSPALPMQAIAGRFGVCRPGAGTAFRKKVFSLRPEQAKRAFGERRNPAKNRV